MIISFTGTGSSGKSTLLSHLRDKNPDFNFVDEVTRKVKREHGVEINEKGSDVTQKLILVEHLANLAAAKKAANSMFILDRCLFDLSIYTTYLHEQGTVTYETIYTIDSVISQELKSKPYDLLFYTDPADVKLVDDGERSINTEFRDTIADMYEWLWVDIERYQPIVKLSGTIDQRLTTIQSTLGKYGIYISI